MKFRLSNIDPRLIYLLVAAALAVPLIFGVTLKPTQMQAADDMFAVVKKLEPTPGKIVVVSVDWGPGTRAENEPQTMLIMEHLFRKRIPFALISLYNLAGPTLQELPLKVLKKLETELPGETFTYGKDWVNLGFRQGGGIAVQSLGRAENWLETIQSDANGNPLRDMPAMNEVRNVRNVQLLVEISSLVGTFNSWLQFFRTADYVPPFVHGCTSISIPDAYLYYSSKQILGFFEGAAGAAWYDTLLSAAFPNRKSVGQEVNSGLAFAQLLILFLIVLGNIGAFFESKGRTTREGEVV